MKKKQFKKLALIIIPVILIIIIAVFIGLRTANKKTEGKLDDFAKCLKDKGLVLYGAFWCTHCHDQKELFGTSQQYLPYVECSTPDANSQLQICQDKNIPGYPTWIMPDGSRESGGLSLETLAQKSGCTLPQ